MTIFKSFEWLLSVRAVDVFLPRCQGLSLPILCSCSVDICKYIYFICYTSLVLVKIFVKQLVGSAENCCFQWTGSIILWREKENFLTIDLHGLIWLYVSCWNMDVTWTAEECEEQFILWDFVEHFHRARL